MMSKKKSEFYIYRIKNMRALSHIGAEGRRKNTCPDIHIFTYFLHIFTYHVAPRIFNSIITYTIRKAVIIKLIITTSISLTYLNFEDRIYIIEIEFSSVDFRLLNLLGKV